MFASRTLKEHILRGVGGFSFFALAVVLAPTSLWALLLLPIGLVLLRGCPMCWTVGLFETLHNTVRQRMGQSPVEFCSSCNLDSTYEDRRGA